MSKFALVVAVTKEYQVEVFATDAVRAAEAVDAMAIDEVETGRRLYARKEVLAEETDEVVTY